jgi:hypothetical protein
MYREGCFVEEWLEDHQIIFFKEERKRKEKERRD